MACDALCLRVAGHVSVEINPAACRVLESRFPASTFVEDVATINDEMVKSWACQCSQVGLVLLGSGPPCQGVSGLNADRRGAQKDYRSKLYVHVPRVRQLLQKHFRQAQVHSLTESVQSMDEKDRQVMSQDFGLLPWAIDSAGVSLARRPRLYWVTWELQGSEGAN